MDLDLHNWLLSGKYRVAVLRLLSEKPSLPSLLSKDLNIHRSSIARILNDLINEELISKTTKNAKTTTYFLTEKGKKIVGEINSG
jgi:DNA-binding HxlR family transcriptional regulator